MGHNRSAIGTASRTLATVLVAVAMFSAWLAPAAAQQATPSPSASARSLSDVQSAVDWLLAQEAEDGGFIGYSGSSDAGTTVDALIALGAAKRAGI